MSFGTVDLAEFAAAQDWLIDTLGQRVAFETPVPPEYDPSVVLGPDGRPMDPHAEPIRGGGYASAEKVVTLVIRGMTGAADARFEPGGIFSGMDAIVKLKSSDHADVRDASRIVIPSGDAFAIRQWKPHPFGPTQWIFGYCEAL